MMIRAIPPATPPTMAPTGTDFSDVDLLVGFPSELLELEVPVDLVEVLVAVPALNLGELVLEAAPAMVYGSVVADIC